MAVGLLMAFIGIEELKRFIRPVDEAHARVLVSLSAGFSGPFSPFFICS